MVIPTTSWPCSFRSKAATDESTPPLMAMTTLSFIVPGSSPRTFPCADAPVCRGHGPEALHDFGKRIEDLIDLPFLRVSSEAEAQRPAGLFDREADGPEHVGGLHARR